jgi:hypothetical protein
MLGILRGTFIILFRRHFLSYIAWGSPLFPSGRLFKNKNHNVDKPMSIRILPLGGYRV